MAKINSRTSTVRKWTMGLLIVFALVAVIGGTYSRYSTTGSGNATVSVAKWAVAIKNGSKPIAESQNVAFVLDSNPNVAAGKIAPASTATATITVDMTGTEVAALLSATIDNSALATVFGDAAGRVTLTTTIDGTTYASGANAEIALADVSAVHNIVLTLTWTEDGTAAVNTADTTVGTKGDSARTITLPVTITATQKV